MKGITLKVLLSALIVSNVSASEVPASTEVKAGYSKTTKVVAGTTAVAAAAGLGYKFGGKMLPAVQSVSMPKFSMPSMPTYEGTKAAASAVLSKLASVASFVGSWTFAKNNPTTAAALVVGTGIASYFGYKYLSGKTARAQARKEATVKAIVNELGSARALAMIGDMVNVNATKEIAMVLLEELNLHECFIAAPSLNIAAACESFKTMNNVNKLKQIKLEPTAQDMQDYEAALQASYDIIEELQADLMFAIK